MNKETKQQVFAISLKGEVEVRGKIIKHLEGGFGENCKIITDRDIAIEHDVTPSDIRKLINRNITRFIDGIDYIDLKEHVNIIDPLKLGYTKMQIGKASHIYILSERGYKKILNIMDNKQNGEIILKEYFNASDYDTFVDSKEVRKEIYFMNKLIETLKPFNIKGTRQYYTLGYRIDFYIPSLNIAIEYDENNHNRYTYEQHEGRQNKIENELGCKFIRVSDKETDEYNIGYIIKKIFNI